jgi:hypothetical protein
VVEEICVQMAVVEEYKFYKYFKPNMVPIYYAIL